MARVDATRSPIAILSVISRGTSSPPLRKPHPVCTMTAIRAVTPAAEEVVVIRNRPSHAVWKHAEGVGYGPLFGCTILAAALWLLGSGL